MILYHATFGAYLDSIMTNGLGGKEAQSHPNWDRSRDVVCLAVDEELAVSMCESSPNAPDEVYKTGIYLLEVDVSGLELEIDPNVAISNAIDVYEYYEYPGIIPVDRITNLGCRV